ncbi:hypothetical protein UFOVP703_31 [uncultured Caudovirales phage]|uniref:Uncharacterized protein n=1 Tax=uncultured Caudovirales phage TaxID=2100421 RepID=A0A6J5NG93_9CAUD|nr:hypothetical protein UFOVP703_31 [uncultured Caudovirales phage]
MRPNHNRQGRGHNQAPRILDAKRPDTCAELGTPIKPGDSILWDPAAGKAYSRASSRYVAHEDQQRANDWNRAHNMADANW